MRTARFLLISLYPVFVVLGKKGYWYKCKAINFVQYYSKEHILRGAEENKIMMIREGLYNYFVFNVCFLDNMLSCIVHALSNGYIPVIQLDHRKTGWNDWDVFFNQPFIENDTNQAIETVNCDVKVGYLTSSYRSPFVPNEFKIWCKLYKDFVIFNQKTKDYLESEYTNLIKPGMRIIGVKCRGTDYITKKPKNHPVQPEVAELINLTKVKMMELNIQYVFLATEEKRIAAQFQQEFPDQVLVNEQCYYDEIYYKNSLNCSWEVSFERNNDNYLKGIEYLSSIYLLSKCNALIAGNCGGSRAALYMNDMKYEYWKLFDLGVY